MKKIPAALLLLFSFQIVMTQTNDEYKHLFREKITIEKSGSSIAAAFVGEKENRFVSFGTISKEVSAKEADENTIYEIGSITKLFLGVLLADAVKRGEVKLDDPISKYLPETVKTPKFNGREITLLDLAAHSSSLPRLPTNLAPKNPLDPYADYTTQNLYDFLSNYKLTREIGSQYEYSNLASGLLGHILSLRTKTGLESLMSNRIFKPLEMKDTSFSLPESKKSRHARGLNQTNEPTPPWFFDALAGAGAIRSTSADMAKFIAAAVGITRTPLLDAFIEARKMRRQGQNEKVKIGLFWNNVDLFGTEVFWHGGGTFGFSSYVAIDPKQKKGAFLVNNSGQETGSVFLESVAFNFLQSKFPIREPIPVKAEISLPEAVLQSYAGEYEIAQGFSITVTREANQLFAQAAGQGKFELFAEKEDSFFAKITKLSIIFKKDENGKIAGLVIYQGGRETPAKKIK